MLCEACKVIVIDPSKIVENSRHTSRGAYALGEPRLDSYPDFPGLKSSGDAGCELCIEFRRNLLQDFEKEPLEIIGNVTMDWFQIDISDDDEKPIFEETDHGEWNREVKISSPIISFQSGAIDSLTFHVERKNYVHPRSFTYDIQADRGNPAAIHGKVYHRPLDGEALSSRNVGLVKEWIHSCIQDHKYCSVNLDVELPSRVIDVGPSDGSKDPYLMISGGLRGRYVALSHCWGKPTVSMPHFKTETHNIRERMAGIPLKSLPLNFHDAVIATRKLELRYLWIDSLCIVQDDPMDWAREAAKMNYVYACAYLTISATSSLSTHDGFLQRPKLPYKVVKMPYQSLEDDTIKGEFYLKVRSRTQSRDIISTNWNHRGWTFQERVLSARILHFCEERLCFECRGGDSTEDNQWPDVKQQAYWLKPGSREKLWMMTSETPTSEPHRTYWFWRMMVSTYTEREFTNEKDLYPALLGLINEMRSLVDDDCYWGIWKESFQRGLLWCSYGDSNAYVLARPKEPRAPTWSWLSVNGKVIWNRHSYNQHTQFSLRILDLGTLDMNHMALSWRIKLRGKLRLLSARFDTENKRWPIQLYYDGQKVGLGCFDIVDSEVKDKEIWLLEVESDHTNKRPSHQENRLAGLLLRQSQEFQETFSRTGFALRDEDSAIFANIEPRTIFLV